MNIYMNKFTYEYDSDGKVSDAQVGLYGNDSDGEYVSCNLVVKQDDLGDGKTFDNVTIKDIFEITKKKVLAYLQPDDQKKATDATA
ncbi:MAG TPA: hypothetical protein H9721_02180 [Candidatus Limosilactobacillus intestinipullorum]|nr:hypothetical protein [Candidatus Limosilactobacillus intestinipullorum]